LARNDVVCVSLSSLCMSLALHASLFSLAFVVFLPPPFSWLCIMFVMNPSLAVTSVSCPPPSHRYTKGEVEIQLGLYKEAFLTLRQALQLNPQVRDGRSRPWRR
jgi:hypothetical protein